MDSETPIGKLKGLSINARGALLRAGIETIEKAQKLSDDELLSLPGLKASSLNRIRRWPEILPPATRLGDTYVMQAQSSPPPAAETNDREREERFWLYAQELAKGADPEQAKQEARRLHDLFAEDFE